ncbi:hypothetical protein KMW28_15915 [Flammeovirga yaeyamensis]|uniref:Lipoprotein n=1 Tax=Flammeovirga yaeyamensis TaxID=367791 RepID=A0AAX1N1A1_9BACT|nr:hypothetical protein [Flammeovirga yaeyamensis]MBB3698505.1 hypothetical protein [Flammeovirga yaeyamensis]NMF34146.1 hypothetical protein [Flammeovirga yaeyamensis]QWG01131.1 hypothetical protein KMW28_15915 [Flammeovirga yaeyamensis]
MKKFNLLSLLFAAFLAIAVSSCSSDDKDVTPEVEKPDTENPDTEKPPLTEEEIQEQTRQELAATSDSIFKAMVEDDWKLVEFVPSDELLVAKESDQAGTNAFANTKILKAKAVQPKDFTLSFTKEGDHYDVSVNIPAEGDDLYNLILDYQNTLYPDFADLGFLVLPQEELMADAKSALAGPFAAEGLDVDEISDADTGMIIFTVKQNDVSELSYTDMLLNYSKVLKDNADRIFFNEEGQLIVENTDNIYGTGASHYVFKKAE